MPTGLPHLLLSTSTLDRDAARRPHTQELIDLAAARSTVVVLVADECIALAPGQEEFYQATQGATGVGVAPWYLGKVSGVAFFASLASVEDYPLASWVTLREAAMTLPGDLVQCAATAIALAHWHGGHGFCSQCGAATTVVQAGWVRSCPQCGTDHYPRTDSAVIMTVLDRDDRLLLARSPRWPAGRMSLLAGFLEPGESLEDAVRRETVEETGVRVGAVRYVASQSWPFPRSIMVGFTAVATSTEITVDGTEIECAQWFSRAEYDEALRLGEVTRGSSLSISSQLIQAWCVGQISLASG